ncbi:amidohydrolase [Chitinivibrio alkaliphilus ACht1]|uniref:Amidohydrolase n=2 Tax=Chitinivibrio TaxID=1505231 RepID=U7D9L4_9BACT|nr:amidohydrolase [Chitinivibrio alkaliphilus ACht1]
MSAEKTPEEDSNKKTIVLYNGLIIDGTGTPPIENGVVVIQGERITAVGSREEIKIPQKAVKKNLEGKTILPGFINTHVHYAYDERNLKKWLRAGITTVRDLCPGESRMPGSTGGNLTYIRKRDTLNQRTDLTRILSATSIMGVPGGYGYGSRFSSVKEAQELVNSYIDDNVDVIKFAITDFEQGRPWELPTFEQIQAITETARSRGIKTSAHINLAEHLQWAIDAGVDDIAHMVVDPVDDTTIQQIIDAGIYWIPTLELWDIVSSQFSLDYRDVAMENLKKFYQVGGKIALGTDFEGFMGDFDRGFPRTEIQLMKKAGMSNMAIIVAGTKNASFVCGIEEELGTLEAGKIADIMVVSGNPLQDITHLEKIFLVLHEGIVAYEK